MKNDIMAMNDNILLSSIMVLCSLSICRNISYSMINLFWILLIVICGNVRRINDNNVLKMVMRKSLYILPLLLPIMIGFKMPKGQNLITCNVIGVSIGIIFLLPKLDTWRLLVASDFIEMRKKTELSDAITMLVLFLLTPICEEYFFRGFVLNYINGEIIWISIGLSTFLFMAMHVGSKWGSSFSKYDIAIQIIFSIISCILTLISKSIVPGVVMHFMYNSPHIVHQIKCIYIHHYKVSIFYRKYIK